MKKKDLILIIILAGLVGYLLLHLGGKDSVISGKIAGVYRVLFGMNETSSPPISAPQSAPVRMVPLAIERSQIPPASAPTAAEQKRYDEMMKRMQRERSQEMDHYKYEPAIRAAAPPPKPAPPPPRPPPP